MKSVYSYILSAAVLLYTSLFFYPTWQKDRLGCTFSWDVCGYYGYLPSAFIYHDLKEQRFGDGVIHKYGFTPTFSQGTRMPNGGYVLNYSSGMAVLYSPFFALAHVLARPLGYPADGFSKPYMAAIALGSLFIALLGLWYLRRLLLFYFSDRVVAILIFLLAVGTNYLCYAAIAGALTHNWLFTLYVFLLLATRAYYKTYKTKYAVAIGCLCGMAVLVRPSEMVAMLIPLLWGMEGISLKAVKLRASLLSRHYRQILLAAICVVVIGSLQLFYWKYVSGHWLVYSYGTLGFSWINPHFFNYALSYRSGWLVYTPMMILAFIGLLPFLRSGRNRLAVLVFFAINFYIVCAWDVWWYGGLGGRAMIQSYPVLCFPIGALIDHVLRHRLWTILLTPFTLLAVYLNLWVTVQSFGGEGLLDSESMTRAYYWRVAGRWHAPDAVKKLKDIDELFEGVPQSHRLIYTNDFESDTSIEKRPDAISGSRSVHLDKQHDISEKLLFRLPDSGAGWIRAQATFRIGKKEWTYWQMTQFIVGIYSKGEIVKEKMIRVHRFLDDGDTKDIFFDVKLPDKKIDSCRLYFWNVGSECPILIDNIKVWTFRE